MKATIIADASFCEETKAGAWACWIRYDNRQLIKFCRPFKVTPQNSNEAERYAALNSIYLCIRCAPQPLKKIFIKIDNVNALRELTTEKVQSVLPSLLIPLLRANHIPAHVRGSTRTSHICHAWCDRAARRRMREVRKA